MPEPGQPSRLFSLDESLFPRRARALRRGETIALAVGLICAILRHGLLRATETRQVGLGLLVVAAMVFLQASLGVRHYWSRARKSFRRRHRVDIAVATAWAVGTLLILIFGGVLAESLHGEVGRGAEFLLLTELLVAVRSAIAVIAAVRSATAGVTNPAIVLVASFAMLIAIGTALLSLPEARADGESAPFLTALFTSTSASCVTGLIVEPTGEYWSRFGQWVILGLFQIGGLGIMTFGAFFAVMAGRHMRLSEAVTLREMLESDDLADVRRLVLAILIFTFGSELIGAVLMSGLWADKPFGECAFYSVFHSVSAFCNAGFALTDNSFVDVGTRWEIWGVACGLVIVGGMGFAVLYNLAHAAGVRFRRLNLDPLFELTPTRVRLTLTTRLAVVSTGILLVGGAIAYAVLESTGPSAEKGESPTFADKSLGERAAESWFQSVTFRTAGFNTVDHSELQPATKLFATGLMFIGACPGSTGGGVKTVTFALAVLALFSVLRGRNRVELMGRTIPNDQFLRALAIVLLGMVALLGIAVLLVLFENQPDRFLDHLFEAASAFGTVGVSTGITGELTPPSQLTLIVAMFLGRVGPLTLLLALASGGREARYEYPLERVTLG